MLALDGEAYHIHAVMEYPPKYSASVLVNTIKGTSSNLRKERPDLARYRRDVLWSPPHLVPSTGGGTPDAIRRYAERRRASPFP